MLVGKPCNFITLHTSVNPDHNRKWQSSTDGFGLYSPVDQHSCVVLRYERKFPAGTPKPKQQNPPQTHFSRLGDFHPLLSLAGAQIRVRFTWKCLHNVGLLASSPRNKSNTGALFIKDMMPVVALHKPSKLFHRSLSAPLCFSHLCTCL